MAYRKETSDMFVELGVYAGSSVIVPAVSKAILDLPTAIALKMHEAWIQELLANGWSTASSTECGALSGLGEFTEGKTVEQIGTIITVDKKDAIMKNPQGQCCLVGMPEFIEWLNDIGFKGLYSVIKPSTSLRALMGIVKIADAKMNFIQRGKYDDASMVTGVVDLLGAVLSAFNINPAKMVMP